MKFSIKITSLIQNMWLLSIEYIIAGNDIYYFTTKTERGQPKEAFSAEASRRFTGYS